MINKVEFEKSDSIVVISKGENEDELTFASNLRDNLQGFDLQAIEGSQIRFKLPTDKGGSSSCTVYSSHKVLIRDRRLVLSNCENLIDSHLINLK